MNTHDATGWWKDYFSRHYGQLYRGVLADELTTGIELKTLQRLFKKAEHPIVDLGCGHGRHLAPLAAAGLPVLGIDYSPELMDMIAKKHRRRLLRGDMRALPLATAMADGAWCLFNTFGYFSDDDNLTVLREAARILRPGAPLLLDAPSRAGMREVVKTLPASTRIQDDVEIYESWELADGGRRLRGEGIWVLAGDRKEWRLSIRLYTPVEMERLLRKAGFTGEIEIRPIGEFGLLGSRHAQPSRTHACWRRATNMAVMAFNSR